MAQPYPSTSKGYLSSYRGVNAPGAYYEVKQTDFGALGGAAPSLAYNAGAGSLASSTARAAISWITAQGESTVSTEATVTISASSGAFTITQPTVPTNNGTVIGWRVYSSSGAAGSALLNTAPTSTTQVQSNIVTTQGTLLAFPIATTSVQVLIYGTGQAEPAFNNSGIQQPLPSVGANTTSDYYIIVPNAGSMFGTQPSTNWMRPQGIPDGTGITATMIGYQMPLYPGTSASVSVGAYMILNSYLFVCTTAGTTASTFIGFSAFTTTRLGTTTDGTVTWTCLSKAGLINLRFSNASGSAAAPVAQEMDFFQL
jgi:hypothetical protein